jgi:outer membrane protein OmpA-like peptidoglycan-associated protein
MIGLEGERFGVVFNILSQKNYTDSSASGSFTFLADKDEAAFQFQTIRAGFDAEYKLMPGATVCPTVGAGIGYHIWKYVDPVGDTVIQTVGERDNRVDFSAAEMYVSGSLGILFRLGEKIDLGVKTSVDYLTGIGSSFGEAAEDMRGRTLMRATLSLSYRFGGGGGGMRSPEGQWRSDKAWSEQKESTAPKVARGGDGDGDGVADKKDKCPDTPMGALVDKRGCPTDSDHDGVWDGLDDCPRTPRAAFGFVDLFGCPIDADFDGVADYMDSCLGSPEGVAVDAAGCPLDSDGDGVYDGRDDCPNTAPGIEVDKRGCIDIAFLRDIMRINIDYPSGSFEVDVRTRERLKPLVAKLKILDHVRIDIVGYTDNVGPAEANQELSQKRANRMRDWLESMGIARDRMRAIGRGETNFVTSNQTSEGRALNRRIELIFSY